MKAEEITAKWLARLDEWVRFKTLIAGEAVCREVLADLNAFLSTRAEELVDLRQAATLSGYSKDHLRRLVRAGRLRTDRHGRRLFFRVGDLPKKPGGVDPMRHHGYDPVADARQVAAQRIHGGKSHDAQTVA